MSDYFVKSFGNWYFGISIFFDQIDIGLVVFWRETFHLCISLGFINFTIEHNSQIKGD